MIEDIRLLWLLSGRLVPHAIVRFHHAILPLLRLFVVGDPAADYRDCSLHSTTPKLFLDMGDLVSLDRRANLYRGRGDPGRRSSTEFLSGLSPAAQNPRTGAGHHRQSLRGKLRGTWTALFG